MPNNEIESATDPLTMPEKEYVIFCDESDWSGKFYSSFFGGILLGASQYDRITERLNKEKQRLNLFAEVKWSKVSEPYLAKYQELIRAFFSEVEAAHVRIRIMFRQNAHAPVALTEEQIEGAYFRLLSSDNYNCSLMTIKIDP